MILLKTANKKPAAAKAPAKKAEAKAEKKEIMDFSSESGYSILELIRIGIEKIRSQKK